ncbi:MAG: hypothetical protein GWP10_06530 [Nitrospiraceae bacterium]|nr:hypothetical protein [Nitrospiraceae bacterium]
MQTGTMTRKDLRHDRHIVLLLTNHIVFSPKYVGEVAEATEEIIRKICRELDIEVIDMAANVDHVHLLESYTI